MSRPEQNNDFSKHESEKKKKLARFFKKITEQFLGITTRFEHEFSKLVGEVALSGDGSEAKPYKFDSIKLNDLNDILTFIKRLNPKRDFFYLTFSGGTYLIFTGSSEKPPFVQFCDGKNHRGAIEDIILACVKKTYGQS